MDGYKFNSYSQRSYVDYEPITGKGMRTAVRQQVCYPAMNNLCDGLVEEFTSLSGLWNCV